MKIEVSNGEILDKMSVLKIKEQKIEDNDKRVNVLKEIEELQPFCDTLTNTSNIKNLYDELCKVNSILWEVEDEIRECEYSQNFGEEFIRLARMVYITNDERAKIKKEINVSTNSKLVEEKSYKK